MQQYAMPRQGTWDGKSLIHLRMLWGSESSKEVMDSSFLGLCCKVASNTVLLYFYLGAVLGWLGKQLL